jgi:hypothetical protein
MSADAFSPPGEAKPEVTPLVPTVRATEPNPQIPARPLLLTPAVAEERQAMPVSAPPIATPVVPLAGPQATVTAEPVTAVPAGPGHVAREPSPPAPVSPALVPAYSNPLPPLPPREIEIRSETLVRAEAQPILPPPAEQERVGPEPQVVTILPPPEVRPDTQAAPPAALQGNSPPPTLIIEIGQIDIRLEAPARTVAMPAAPRRQTPVISLDDYLRARS